MSKHSQYQVSPGESCPHCGDHIEYFTDTTDHGHAPDPGNLMICAACGGVNVMGETFTLTKLTEAEWNRLPVKVKRMIHVHRTALYFAKNLKENRG